MYSWNKILLHRNSGFERCPVFSSLWHEAQFPVLHSLRHDVLSDFQSIPICAETFGGLSDSLFLLLPTCHDPANNEAETVWHPSYSKEREENVEWSGGLINLFQLDHHINISRWLNTQCENLSMQEGCSLGWGNWGWFFHLNWVSKGAEWRAVDRWGIFRRWLFWSLRPA